MKKNFLGLDYESQLQPTSAIMRFGKKDAGKSVKNIDNDALIKFFGLKHLMHAAPKHTR